MGPNNMGPGQMPPGQMSPRPGQMPPNQMNQFPRGSMSSTGQPNMGNPYSSIAGMQSNRAPLNRDPSMGGF